MKKIFLALSVLVLTTTLHSEAYAKGSSGGGRSSSSFSSSRSSSYSSYRSSSSSSSPSKYSSSRNNWSWNSSTVSPSKATVSTTIKPVVVSKPVTSTYTPAPVINKVVKPTVVVNKPTRVYRQPTQTVYNNSSSDVANVAIAAVAMSAIASSANANENEKTVQTAQAVQQPTQSYTSPIVSTPAKVTETVSFSFVNDCYKWICE